MKKLIITAIIAIASLPGAYAQLQDAEARADSLQQELDAVNLRQELDRIDSKVWGKGRFLRIGYATAQTVDEFSPVEKSKYAFFITKGTTFFIPKRPIAGILKFGIDAVWFDAQFSKFNSPYSSQDWTSEIVIDDSDNNDDDFSDYNLNIGCMGLSFAMGVGPSVSVAPFARTSITGLQPLRASIYFHYSPTVQLYMKSQDGDVELSTAFCNMMNFGGFLTYRAISLGLEGRWGSGKFKPVDFQSLFDDSDSSTGAMKYKRKFASTRFYIQFRF